MRVTTPVSDSSCAEGDLVLDPFSDADDSKPAKTAASYINGETRGSESVGMSSASCVFK